MAFGELGDGGNQSLVDEGVVSQQGPTGHITDGEAILFFGQYLGACQHQPIVADSDGGGLPSRGLFELAPTAVLEQVPIVMPITKTIPTVRVGVGDGDSWEVRHAVIL